MGTPADPPQDQSPTFADLLMHLFATRVSPQGRPYSLREVSEGTGGKLSIAYLSLLRRGGGLGLPSADKVQALADFFDVDISYFLRARPVNDDRSSSDRALEQALANPQVRDIAMRASTLGDAERQFIVQMLEQAHQLTARIKAREAGDAASRAETAGDFARAQEDTDTREEES